MPVVTRVAGTVIGAVQEARYARKEKKLAENGELDGISPTTSHGSLSLSREPTKEDDEEDYDEEEDNEDWALDEEAAKYQISRDDPPEYSDVAGDKSIPIEEAFKLFEKSHAKAFKVNPGKETPLPDPIILPQRRPKTKARGFVRAYAPALGECKGIDQATFMRFLEDFDKSSRASPVFDVVNAAAMVVGAIPNPLSPVTIGVSIAAQFISNTGKEIQGRYRTNAYLNMINDYLFKPHGLYCLLMTYKPQEPGSPIVEVDINQNIKSDITQANDVPDNAVRARMRNLRISSGKTTGSFQLPESSPLIYPGLDAHFSKDSNQKQQSTGSSNTGGIRAHANFIQDYMDRRSQAAYAYQNPGTKLAAMPEQQFHSKFADPNHPMYAGGLMTFLSGGKIDSGSWYRERRVRRAERKAAKNGMVLSEEEKLAISRRHGGPAGFVGRHMGQDVLYLLIANLPSQAEMEEARLQLQQAKEEKEREKRQKQGHAKHGIAGAGVSTSTTGSRGSLDSASTNNTTPSTSMSPAAVKDRI